MKFSLPYKCQFERYFNITRCECDIPRSDALIHYFLDFDTILTKYRIINVDTIFSKQVSSVRKVYTFFALNGMPARTSDENAVRLSVCHTRALRQKGKKFCPDFYTIRKII